MPRPKSDTPSNSLHRRSGRAYATIDGRQWLLPGPHSLDESCGAYDRPVSEWLFNGRTLAGAPSSGYHEARPLFGRVSGRFWWSASARGYPERG